MGEDRLDEGAVRCVGACALGVASRVGRPDGIAEPPRRSMTLDGETVGITLVSDSPILSLRDSG
jgi:hypothetical protein